MAATGDELTKHLWKQIWLQVLFQRNTVPLKILDHCKLPPEIMTVLLKCFAANAPLNLQYALNENACQLHCMYTIAASAAH